MADEKKLLYTGKTKNVYEIDQDTCLLEFKDTATGRDGVFDPGANHVALSIEGAGHAGLALTKFFFEKINAAGIPTHFISADLDKNTMTVHKAEMFGKGVEVIIRYRAVGSFIRRYGRYAEEGMELPAYVETTLKDDDREDPLINSDALEILGIMTHKEYDELRELTKKIGAIVKEELAKKGIELYDIKFEFGRLGADRHVALVDEISGGSMRAYKDGKVIDPMKLEKLVLEA